MQKASSAPKPVDVKIEAKATDGSVWNPNNYFWEEKNYEKWGTEWLKQLLNEFKHSIFGGELEITSVDDLKGTCGVSIRKGKKICSFDYSVKLKWKLGLVDGAGTEVAKVEGEFHFPEISNLVYDDGDKFEINVSYTAGEEHRPWLDPIMKSEVSDHLRA